MKNVRLIFAMLLTLASLAFMPMRASAHCDTLDGPVIASARLALARADVTPILKWVKADAEPEIRAAFARTLKVRALGPEAREVADTLLFETIVRVHRAGEGAPFHGLKPAGSVEPGIALADKAVEGGSAEELIRELNANLAQGIRERLARVRQTGAHADNSVAQGREYVAAYVDYIHFVESVHDLTATRGHAAHESRAELHAH
jgi:hypothetical protein